jgi:hypothetical protein
VATSTADPMVIKLNENGSWATVVQKGKTKNPHLHRRILGTGAPGATRIKAQTEEKEKSWHLFVGRLAPDTTEDELKGHLEDNGISVINCRLLERKEKWQEKYAAFKVIVKRVDSNAIFDEGIWPTGADIRDWYFSEKPNNTN